MHGVQKEHENYEEGYGSRNKKTGFIVYGIRRFEFFRVKLFHAIRRQVVPVDPNHDHQRRRDTEKEDCRENVNNKIDEPNFVEGTTNDDIWRVA